MARCDPDIISRLGRAALFDVTCSDEKIDPADLAIFSGLNKDAESNSSNHPEITHVNTCGRRMPILKVLLTTHCEYNCLYCGFRRDIDRPRESITSSELAETTINLSRAGKIEGIFLSSGIGGSVRKVMTSIVDTGRILREKYQYSGYIHLKILPGSPLDLIEAAGKYADRLSINMEAPSESALRDIAPNKSIRSNILERMQWIEILRRQGKIPRHVGQVTQFVVGGTDDYGASDRSLVTVAEYLYRELNFRRIYYSPFHPVRNTPLEGRQPEDPRRTLRLYQADKLIALYGFKPDELIYNQDGKLDLETDPKLAWAQMHPELFPIEITRADYSVLIRVPGIGQVLAKRILKARSEGQLKSFDDLLKLGRIPLRSMEYILINGKKPQKELAFFNVADSSQLVLPLSPTNRDYTTFR